MPIVFFCRLRPQGCDAVDLALQTRRVFIGYPAWRDGKLDQEHSFRSALIDLSVPDQDADLLDQSLDAGYRRQVSANRNLVREVDMGSIVLMPRPARGVVYAAFTDGFELVDDPTWGETYLALRTAQRQTVEPRGSHLADVVQGWRVDQWHALPFPLIPAWIRASLLGRSTVGRIRPLALGDLRLDPLAILRMLIEAPDRTHLPWTSELAEVELRLVTSIGPNTLEHLVVALLQLEHPSEIWSHVGGSGDGGVDGMGANAKGRVVGLVQCKWSYDGHELPFAGEAELDPSIERFVATLVHTSTLKASQGTRLLDRPTIAKLILKHADTLPWARTMRIASNA